MLDEYRAAGVLDDMVDISTDLISALAALGATNGDAWAEMFGNLTASGSYSKPPAILFVHISISTSAKYF